MNLPDELSRMEFVTIPAGLRELGWRFSEGLEVEAQRAILEDTPVEWRVARFSIRRQVSLEAFEIATTSIRFEELLGDPYSLGEVDTLAALCDLLDLRLATIGLRLPTEDELEAAAGGSLFPWGLHVPDGIPYGRETTFGGHKLPNEYGLRLSGDPYKVEVSRQALKFGDGGTAVCGGYPWPMAWLALSPSHRLLDADIEECFPETLEEAFVRPVRIA